MTRTTSADILAASCVLSIPVAITVAVAHGHLAGVVVMAVALAIGLIAWGVRGRG